MIVIHKKLSYVLEDQMLYVVSSYVSRKRCRDIVTAKGTIAEAAVTCYICICITGFFFKCKMTSYI